MMQETNEAIIELTTRCNLSCAFCYNHLAERMDMPFDTVTWAIDEMAHNDIPAVRLTGGEPLLYPRLQEVISYAKEKGRHVIINTNATLIERGNVTLFRHVDYVLISTHTHGMLHEAVRAISNLHHEPCRCMLATMISEESVRDITTFYKAINRLPAIEDWFFLRPLPRYAGDTPLGKDLLTRCVRALLALNAQAQKPIQIANALPFCATPQPLHEVCKGGSFDSGYSRIFIDVEGRIRPSHNTDAIGEKGTIPLSEALSGKTLNDIRSYRYLPATCLGCQWLETCKGGLLRWEYLRKEK